MSKQNYENKWIIRGKSIWLYFKCQLVTKIILSWILLPIYYIVTSFLIHSSGRTNISSGDYIGFFTSVYGVIAILLSLVFLIVVLGMDVNTFIIISSLIEEEKLNIKISDVLKQAFFSMKYFFSLIGIFIVLFVGLIFPMIDIGIKLTPLQHFKIPNFIISVIFDNLFYLIIYYAFMLILIVISVLYIFTLHFIMIEKMNIKRALRYSRKTVKKHFFHFVRCYIWMTMKAGLVMFGIGLSILFIYGLMAFLFCTIYKNTNIMIISGLILVLELVALFSFFSVPIMISILTKLFYQYRTQDNVRPILKLHHSISKPTKIELNQKIKLRTKLTLIGVMIVVLIINGIISVLLEANFDHLLNRKVDIALVAHRGGGDLGAENTVEGIKAAMTVGAKWSEIDIQRTKDGRYILNHDKNFARVTGDSRTPMEMTLEEIKQLQVKNTFHPDKESQKVPTLEEVLEVSRNRIGLFIELKGKSADYKMVDDVVKIIKDKKMLHGCVLLSLDYKIIEYIEHKYPEVETGFLYFFSAGKLKDLQGDYLIMEENEATDDHIDEIHQVNKKAVVWTVNTQSSIEKFIGKEVDAIITDHILLVQEHIKMTDERSGMEIIFDDILQMIQEVKFG